MTMMVYQKTFELEDSEDPAASESLRIVPYRACAYFPGFSYLHARDAEALGCIQVLPLAHKEN